MNQFQTYEAVWARLHHLPPLGWRVNDNGLRFEPDPPLFPLLKETWALVLRGVPVQRSLAWLNDHGARTPKRSGNGGRPITRCALYRVLHDPFYCGLIRWQGNLVPGMHEGMITREEFEAVQKALQRRHK